MNPADLNLKLDRARWWLLSREPFYGSLAMALPDVLGNPHGKTACTDAVSIYWDQSFLAKLSDEETRFILAHETLHNAHGHFWRFPVSDKQTGQACDYAINGTLARIDGMKMPAGGLLNPAFADLAEEEILHRLQSDDQKQQQQGQKPQQWQQGAGQGQGQPQAGQGDDPCGDFTQPPQGQGKPQQGQSGAQSGSGQGQGQGSGSDAGAGQSTEESLKDQWAERVIQAAQAARAQGRGSIPGDMQGMLAKVLAQPVDWRREMADFVRDAMTSRNDWTRSARRMATAPVIYPRRRQDDLGLVVLARDTSGSISDEIAAEFSALISSALAETGCRGLVLDADTRIQAENWLNAGEECPLSRAGYGGTDFAAVFAKCDELAEQGERIAGLVYLTDGDGSGEPDTTETPTLWLCTTGKKMRTGRTVKIEG